MNKSIPIIRFCECCDPGCPHHPGQSKCNEPSQMLLKRCDMEDRTGTLFCEACGEDALESGVFG